MNIKLIVRISEKRPYSSQLKQPISFSDSWLVELNMDRFPSPHCPSARCLRVPGLVLFLGCYQYSSNTTCCIRSQPTHESKGVTSIAYSDSTLWWKKKEPINQGPIDRRRKRKVTEQGDSRQRWRWKKTKQPQRAGPTCPLSSKAQVPWSPGRWEMWMKSLCKGR